MVCMSNCVYEQLDYNIGKSNPQNEEKQDRSHVQIYQRSRNYTLQYNDRQFRNKFRTFNEERGENSWANVCRR